MSKNTSNVVALATKAPTQNPEWKATLKQCVEQTDRFVEECSQLKDQGVDLAAKFNGIGYPLRELPDPVLLMIAEQKAENAVVKAELAIPAWLYGHFCAAAAVHGKADWKEMLLDYLHCTVCEWSNTGYYLDE